MYGLQWVRSSARLLGRVPAGREPLLVGRAARSGLLRLTIWERHSPLRQLWPVHKVFCGVDPSSFRQAALSKPEMALLKSLRHEVWKRPPMDSRPATTVQQEMETMTDLKWNVRAHDRDHVAPRCQAG